MAKIKTTLFLAMFFMSGQLFVYSSTTEKMKLIIKTKPFSAKVSVLATDKNQRTIRSEVKLTPCLFEFNPPSKHEAPLSVYLQISKENYVGLEDRFNLDDLITTKDYSLHYQDIDLSVTAEKALSKVKKPTGLKEIFGALSPKTDKISYGPTFGLSLARQCEEDVVNAFKMGLAVGGFITCKLNDEFSLVGQLLYVQKGYRYSSTMYNNPYEYDLSLNYLEIPILARYAFGSDNLRFFLLAGPAIAFKTGGKFGWRHDGQYVEGTDLSHKDTDFGLKFGGGLGYPLGHGWIVFELGVTLGFLRTLENSTNTNAAILAMLSYLFGRL